jgi:hypothetical protein
MYAMAGCMADTVGTVLVVPTADCDVGVMMNYRLLVQYVSPLD